MFIFFIQQIVSGQLNLSFPVTVIYPTLDQHVLPVFFGGTEVADDQTVVSAPAMQMVYFVAVDTKRQLAK